MHGTHPDTGKIVEEYIEAANIEGYKNAGWNLGPIPPPEVEVKPLVKYADAPKAEAVFHTMHGPDIDNPEKIVEAEIEADNVIAYQQAGWVLGAIEPVEEETEKPKEESVAEKPAPDKKDEKHTS